MAELDIGKHCNFDTCGQLDFLPFVCSGCSLIFCKEHSAFESHHCSQANIPEDHGEYTGPKGFSCDLEGCSNRELTAVVCDACQKNFCLKHRHQIDHSCAKYEAPQEKMTKTKAHIENIIESKTSSRKKGQGRKSKVTAAKVALMKMKMTAVGPSSIPSSERVYLQVVLPLGSSVKNKAMFFSKLWSTGRIIDAMASNAGIQNNNNVGGAKKLRLFDPDVGHLYETEKNLEGHMADENGIVNGGTVILEYVDDSRIELTDLKDYSI